VLLSARGIGKTYGGVPVLSDVSLELAAGEVHALVGENGAGKSTLLKILSGAARADRGEVTLAGDVLPPGEPETARRRGINIVYQEFTLVPGLSIEANLFLGQERGRFVLSRASMRREAVGLLSRLGLDIAPSTLVGRLSVAHQQLVEIARALSTNAKVLILDEPSATLSNRDVDRLFVILRDLRSQGLAILYVSHRLDEIFTIADRVTVLRDGRHVRTTLVTSTTRDQIIRDMVGREVAQEYPARDCRPGKAALELRDFAVVPGSASVTMQINEGELVGLAGLVGAGRTRTALAMIGRRKRTGRLSVAGREVAFRSAHDALAGGLAYLTEDRKRSGIFPQMSADENISMAHLPSFCRHGVIAERQRRQASTAAAQQMDLRVGSLPQRIATLSGGNQQKALLARYLIRRPAVLILDEPTRGVDIGAREKIYAVINQLTTSGLGVLIRIRRV